MSIPIPVVCGRCGATGIAGEADFTNLGDLLSFEAVPRQLKRRDGWTGVLQREFIARLAQSGSPTLAAEAMRKSLHGVRKLLKDPGGDGFRAAWERAVELGEAAEARRRIAEQAEIDARSAHPSGRPRRGGPRAAAGPAAGDGHGGYGGSGGSGGYGGDGYGYGDDGADEAEDAEGDAEFRHEMLERLVAKFMAKVALEREARLAGRVVEADFTVRQITCLEIAFDLMGEGQGTNGWETLTSLRRGRRGVLELAETPISRFLDASRRRLWAEGGEPARPEHPPERYLAGPAGHRLEPAQALGPASRPPPGIDPDEWAAMGMDEQKRRLDAHYAGEAAAQVEWERQARADAAEWAAREEGKERGKRRTKK